MLGRSRGRSILPEISPFLGRSVCPAPAVYEEKNPDPGVQPRMFLGCSCLGPELRYLLYTSLTLAHRERTPRSGGAFLWWCFSLRQCLRRNMMTSTMITIRMIVPKPINMGSSSLIQPGWFGQCLKASLTFAPACLALPLSWSQWPSARSRRLPVSRLAVS